VETQEKVDKLYKDKTEWTKKSIKGALKSAKFSSDRTIKQYANDIWHITTIPIPMPEQEETKISMVKIMILERLTNSIELRCVK